MNISAVGGARVSTAYQADRHFRYLLNLKIEQAIQEGNVVKNLSFFIKNGSKLTEKNLLQLWDKLDQANKKELMIQILSKEQILSFMVKNDRLSERQKQEFAFQDKKQSIVNQGFLIFCSLYLILMSGCCIFLIDQMNKNPSLMWEAVLSWFVIPGFAAYLTQKDKIKKNRELRNLAISKIKSQF